MTPTLEWRLTAAQANRLDFNGYSVWHPNRALLSVYGQGPNQQEAIFDALDKTKLEAFVTGLLSLRWQMYTTLPQTPESVAAILAADLAVDTPYSTELASEGKHWVVELGLFPLKE